MTESATLEPTPTTDPSAPELPVTVIEPRSGWSVGLGELWRYRELLVFLAWRDIKVRYKQTVLGIGWAFAQPVATMLVFALFLGRMGGLANGVPNYPLFVFAGMVAWTFFSNTVLTAGNSVVLNERLVTKIYFPRLIVPLSTVGVALFDLLLASALLGVMALAYGVTPGWSLLLMPAVVLMLAVAAAGVGVLLSALIVAHRDFKYVLTFGVQLWMFATPCLYMSAEALGPRAQAWLPLNPAYGLILTFRQIVLDGPLDWYAFGVSAAVAAGVFAAGVVYFRRVEQTFADNI